MVSPFRIWLLLAMSVLVGPAFTQMTISNDDIRIVLGGDGTVSGITDLRSSRDWLAPGQPSPLVTIRYNGIYERPSEALIDPSRHEIVLRYPSGVRLTVAVTKKPSHIVFEITDNGGSPAPELVIWGPIPLSVKETVGEIVGVVRDGNFAVGIQILNVKTMGGYPLNSEGSDPSRSNTAKATDWGSVLQAYTLDRSKPRKVNAWWDQFPDMPVPPVPGETVVGSKIALFGCPAAETLKRIGTIEQAEGLPHPLIDGYWSRQSPQSGRSYLIADYSEETIDELLAYTKRANLMTLYHMNAWKSWGHYELDTHFFPNGLNGFHECLRKAGALDIRLGAHTLTDFINTNDPYITPVPDPRLAKTGTSVLAGAVNDTATVLPVASPFYFANFRANWLRTVMIGGELITYDTVTAAQPWALTGCKRGAFGTKATGHQAGSEVAKLMDHPYKVFLPNLDLMKEIAVNLARRFNETGLQQMDFDGHEGCLSAGQGDYGMELFAKLFYDNLDHPVINGTSNSEPFYWHIGTYCNWGEPWYGGFTESMQQYRIDNQGLFDRNYLPHMLGWYLLTDSTTLAEMEWMLARAAGYDAGFAMATSLEALRNNPSTGDLLDAIREWEICRRDHAFPESLKEMLKDPSRNFHLEKLSAVTWNLYPVYPAVPVNGLPAWSRGDPFRIVVHVD